jgi:hypothetical protein
MVQTCWLDGSGAKWKPRGAGAGELEVDHARLDPGDAVVDVDLEDALHPVRR